MALRNRLDDAWKAKGYKSLNDYLVDLLAALHPDPKSPSDQADAAGRLVDALLDSVPAFQQEDLDLLSHDHVAA
ncbi:hypothetical protein AB0D67_38910 [Streptosporangium sp. NPDC048047]|uniref:hypothetical protein n=1 Tax=Streptosporangium sp. NPDC048047 TaxID=3155748 RepID=UPI003418456D